MTATSHRSTMIRRYRTPCIAVLTIPSICSLAFGQVHFDAHCSERVSHFEFVRTALEQVEQGADRAQVLRVLSCIGESDESRIRTRLRLAAVRAIFAVTENDEEIREQLLQLTSHPAVTGDVHTLACDLIAYVADDATAAVLVSRLDHEWPTGRWAGYFRTLKDIGDPGFLAWLETHLSGDHPEQLEYFLEQAASAIRAQRDLKELLRQLKSGEGPLDAAWLVRQASRHGATRVQIREAILTRLRGSENRKPTALRHGDELVRQCDELHLVAPEEAQALEPYRELMQRSSDAHDVPWPPWANARIAEKRAAFYKFDRLVEKKDE